MLPKYKFDVEYITPSGNAGIHYGVEAINEFDAAKLSACMLSFNTKWHPIEWTITAVTYSKNSGVQNGVY